MNVCGCVVPHRVHRQQFIINSSTLSVLKSLLFVDFLRQDKTSLKPNDRQGVDLTKIRDKRQDKPNDEQIVDLTKAVACACLPRAKSHRGDSGVKNQGTTLIIKNPHGIRICIKRKKIDYGKFFDFWSEKCVYN